MSKYITLTALITFALDQLTKLGIIHVLKLEEAQFMDVLPGFINFIWVKNEGVNFGLFSNGGATMQWIWVVIALIVCVVIAFWMRREPNIKALLSAGLVIGGALGNSVDRILYGGVVDFLNISCCGFRNPYSFNVADITIFAGIFGLIIFSTDHKKSDA